MFKDKKFISRSGKRLKFKIECDSLAFEDIRVFTKIITGNFTYKSVDMPETGCSPLQLLKHVLELKTSKDGEFDVLIIDDVFTTGNSMEDVKKRHKGKNIIGVVLFSRGKCPKWITPIFELNDFFQ